VVLNVVENYVVTLIALGEIFSRVIDNVIRSDGANKIKITRAADTGHLCAKGFCNLHCKSAYTTGRAVDQHLLPCMNVPFVAQTL